MNNALNELREALKNELQNLNLNSLKQSHHELSAKYRERGKRDVDRFMKTESSRLSYLATRMPATATVIKRVIEEMKGRQPLLTIESLLDLGSGPGTALWAFSQVFPILKATLVEQDENLIAMGKKLIVNGDHSCFKEAVWKNENILHMKEIEPHDAVIFSYVLNELSREQQAKLIEISWIGAFKNLIIVEPGTPLGYQIILDARQQLIALGAEIIAPCPHKAECPLAKSKDKWCHFSERLERSKEHRIIKGGELGYEDEKYSYLIASKEKGLSYCGRILNHPQKRSGHIYFDLCTANGEEKRTISKREGEVYKQAKKLEWGDII